MIINLIARIECKKKILHYLPRPNYEKELIAGHSFAISIIKVNDFQKKIGCRRLWKWLY